MNKQSLLSCLFICMTACENTEQVHYMQVMDLSFQDQASNVEQKGDFLLDQSINPLDLAQAKDFLISMDLTLVSEDLSYQDMVNPEISALDMNHNQSTWSSVPELPRTAMGELQSGISRIGGIEYLLYWPQQVSPQAEHPIPLLVALHGCDMNARDMAEVTQFNQMADLLGFAVLYPQQSTLSNLNQCWNWFLGINQGVTRHQAGEAYEILQAVDHVAMSYPIQKDDLWVTGISAGAAMTNILGACYHRRVKKILSMAGVAFGLASDANQGLAVMGGRGNIDAEEMGRVGYGCEIATRAELKVMIVQGKDDRTVFPINAQKILKQMMILNDLLDDQSENQSLTIQQLQKQRYEPMVYHAYEISSLNGQAHESKVVLIEVDRLAHAWSGGASGLAYSDPLGPSVGWWFVADF